MAEIDEVRPPWEGGAQIKPGKFIVEAEVKDVTFRDTTKEKPFMVVIFLVTSEVLNGFEFEDRVYFNKKSEWRVRYFLKKFDYPQHLLEESSPLLKRQQIIGLKGKLFLDIQADNYGMMKPNVKKFDHINGKEIEEWLQKEESKDSQDELPLQGKTDAEPSRSIDVNEDVKGEQKSGEGLDIFD